MDNRIIQANKMKALSNKEFPPAPVGATVRVQNPEFDRSRVDPRNALFLITAVKDDKFYTLGNKSGTLSQAYARNQFTVCRVALVVTLSGN